VSGKTIYELAKTSVVEKARHGLYALKSSVRGFCEHLGRPLGGVRDTGSSTATQAKSGEPQLENRAYLGAHSGFGRAECRGGAWSRCCAKSPGNAGLSIVAPNRAARGCERWDPGVAQAVQPATPQRVPAGVYPLLDNPTRPLAEPDVVGFDACAAVSFEPIHCATRSNFTR
jgi:hypothetical protein